MDIVAVIAESKIKEAEKRGEFRNLAGEGKPLHLDDLSGVPADLRVPFMILKNAGMLPPELELKKEIITLQKLIDCCYNDEDNESIRLKRKLNEKILRFNLLMEKRGRNAAVQHYKGRIYDKLGNG